MKLKPKPLCEFKKAELKEHFDDIQKIVAHPRFICSKCARAANDCAFLCKPKKLDF